MTSDSQLELSRYPRVFRFYSPLDPIADLHNLLEALTALEYAKEILHTEHRIPDAELSERAMALRAHLRVALRYIDQAMAGPPEVSFLPAYYGILNLLKAYVITGPYFVALSSQRHHGVTYGPNSSKTHSILDEQIGLKSHGALALAYTAITGETWPDQQMQLSNIYPFIQPIGAEYQLLVGVPSSLAQISLNTELEPGPAEQLRIAAVVYQWHKNPLNAAMLPVLRDFAPDQARPDVLVRGPFASRSEINVDSLVRRCLLYINGGYGLTAVSSGTILLPEEIPIALAFFHLSSVVRYNPEFFYHLRDSQYWPLVAALRRHGLFKAMVLAWSFLHNRQMEASAVVQ